MSTQSTLFEILTRKKYGAFGTAAGYYTMGELLQSLREAGYYVRVRGGLSAGGSVDIEDMVGATGSVELSNSRIGAELGFTIAGVGVSWSPSYDDLEGLQLAAGGFSTSLNAPTSVISTSLRGLPLDVSLSDIKMDGADVRSGTLVIRLGKTLDGQLGEQWSSVSAGIFGGPTISVDIFDRDAVLDKLFVPRLYDFLRSDRAYASLAPSSLDAFKDSALVTRLKGLPLDNPIEALALAINHFLPDEKTFRFKPELFQDSIMPAARGFLQSGIIGDAEVSLQSFGGRTIVETKYRQRIASAFDYTQQPLTGSTVYTESWRLFDEQDRPVLANGVHRGGYISGVLKDENFQTTRIPLSGTIVGNLFDLEEGRYSTARFAYGSFRNREDYAADQALLDDHWEAMFAAVRKVNLDALMLEDGQVIGQMRDGRPFIGAASVDLLDDGTLQLRSTSRPLVIAEDGDLAPEQEIVVTARRRPVTGLEAEITLNGAPFTLSYDLDALLSSMEVTYRAQDPSGRLLEEETTVDVSGRSASIGAVVNGEDVTISSSTSANGQTLTNSVTLGADGTVGETIWAVSGADLDAGLAPVAGRYARSSLFRRDSAGKPVLKDGLAISDGYTDLGTDGAKIRHYTSGPLAGITRIDLRGAPLGIDFRDAGAILGNVLGKSLAGDNRLARAASSAVLKTVGGTLGSLVNGKIGGASAKDLEQVLGSFDEELLRNIKAKGAGALSSFLVSELVEAIGLEGFVGDLVNTAGSEALRTAINGFLGVAKPNIPANVGNAVGAFLGQRLAAELVSFGTVGGQLGSTIGSTLGSIAITTLAVGTSAAGSATLFGLQLGAFAGPVGAAVGAFVGFLVGGVIGSLFGGTPRSGADVVWDAESGRFEVDNAYAKKGGSKDAAIGTATAVAETFNSVLAMAGGTLLNPEAVQSGNYGMRKTDFVYRPTATRDKDAITARFGGKEGAEQLIGHGIYQGLADPDFQIAGGDLYVKRALYNSFAPGALDPGKFDPNVLLGNLASAQRYEAYLLNSAAINALIAAEPDSVFAAEWAIVIARAAELGLTRRHESDWYGGFGHLLSDLDTTPAAIAFGLEYDPASDRYSRAIFTDTYVLADPIDIAGQDVIEGTSVSDHIRLSADRLLASAEGINAGLTVNGQLSNGDAFTVSIAALIDAGAGDDRVFASDRGDNVVGGAGNDVLVGGKLDDWLLGGTGNDRLFAGAVSSVSFDDSDSASVAAAVAADGGSGNYLDGGEGDDRVFGGRGSDWLKGGAGADRLYGGAGGDILDGDAEVRDGAGGEADVSEGGAGSDQYLFGYGSGLDTAFDTADSARPGAAAPGVSDQIQRLNGGTMARNWSGDGQFLVDGSTKGGEDAIAFGANVTMSDILLVRPNAAAGGASNDLVIQLIDAGTGSWNGKDQLTVKDWFVDTRRIEWLRFANGEEIRIGDLTSFKIGTSANDVIIGTLGNDFLYGGDGNDKLFGLAGDDFGVGGKGNDFVAGDSDDDWVLGSQGDDVVVGGGGRDTAFGDDGNDDVYGGDGGDLVVGGRGNDWVVGGAGDDVLRFNRGDGRDTMFDAYVAAWTRVRVNGVYQDGFREDGGKIYRGSEVIFDGVKWLGRFDYDDATNTLSYLVPQGDGRVAANAGSDTLEFGVGIDIDDVQLRRSGDDLELAITRNGAAAEFDAIADRVVLKEWYSTGATIETFQFVETGGHNMAAKALAGGTDGADVLTGSAAQANWMTGNAGDDIVTGGAGDDILNGNSGRDFLRGGEGSDVLYGGSGDDRLEGGGGAYRYDPEFGTAIDNRGADLLIGGAGADAAIYQEGVNAYLGNTAANTGEAYRDRYVGIENIEGGNGADRLGGDDGENMLAGGSGDDVLMAGAGDDSYAVDAGGGADVIREGMLSVEEVLDEAGQPNTALYDFTWSSLGERKVGGREFRDCYQLTVRRKGSGEVVYQSREAVDFTYKRKEAGKAIGDVPMPPAALWPVANGQWKIGFGTGNGLQHVWERIDAAGDGNLAGRDVLELGPNLSLSDLTFSRSGSDGADLVVQVGSSAANKVTIVNQAAGGRVETLQLDDGLAANLASLKINESGEDGDDLVVGTVGNDNLTGGAGHDVLSGGAGSDRLDGGAGNDTLEGGAGADTLVGGDDSITAGLAASGGAAYGDTIRYVRSGEGVIVDLSTNSASGGDAAGDQISGIENVTGSDGFGDTLLGSQFANRLIGLGGNDVLVGAAGDDVLVGGAGIDVLSGGDGADNISAGEGDDADVRGGAGNDLIAGDAGQDLLHGDSGDDTIDGGTGADSLRGGDGGDTLGGGKEDASADTLFGEGGDDKLSGEAGDDRLFGGEGSDVFTGGVGDDHLDGGAGDDTYLFDANSGSDLIVDSGQNRNRVVLTGLSHDRVWLTRSGSDLVIEVIGGDTRITVQGAFADPAAPSIREIVVGNRSLFTKYAELEGLVREMAAASPALPASMPSAVAGRLDAFWWVGNKATPRIEPATVTGAKEDVTVTGRIVSIDHDESPRTFSLVAGSGPTAAQGALTVNADGTWAFVPASDWWGEVSFLVRLIDSDGLWAERKIAFNMAPVNDGPSRIDADQVAGIAERDRPRRESAQGDIELATLGAIDVDAKSPTHLPHTYNKLTVVGDDRFRVFEGKLYLKAGAALDFEEQGQVSVTVRAQDEADPSLYLDRVLTFDVIDIIDLLEAQVDGQLLVGQEPRGGLGGDDELIGHAGANEIRGLGGDDVARGGAGDDLIDGGAGDDELHGELGLDRLVGGEGADRLLGGEHDDILEGGAGTDTLRGGTGKDRLFGGDDADAVFGDAGDDVIVADAGADALDGGDGTDTVDYSGSTSAVSVGIGVGAGAGGLAEGDMLIAVENVLGSAFDDAVVGDHGDNRLEGLAGDDRLSGLGGDDTLEGGQGRDRLLGGDGADVLRGGDGDDGDSWDGSRPDPATDGFGLFGGAGKDLVEAGAGADVLFGGEGNDILDGGAGNDRMDGGSGHDLYEVDRSSGHDRIYNWDPNGDDVDVVGYRDEITRDMLWFRREGDDLIVDVIGQPVSTRVVDWYKATTPGERGNHRIDFFTAAGAGGQPGWTTVQMNAHAMVELMAGIATPASVAEFEAMRSPGTPFGDAWSAAWQPNRPPAIVGVSDQVMNEDGTLTLTLVLNDDVTPADLVGFELTPVDPNDFSRTDAKLVDALSWTRGAADGEVIVTFRPKADASGRVAFKVVATDANDDRTTAHFSVAVRGVADAPGLRAGVDTGGMFRAGVPLGSLDQSSIPLVIQPTLTDTDGSEVLDAVYVEGLPSELSLSAGSRQPDGSWRVEASQLAGLMINAKPPAPGTPGWSQDLTGANALKITAVSRETGVDPGPATPTARSETKTVELIVNTRPHRLTAAGAMAVGENVSDRHREIGTLVGQDADGDALTYEIVAGHDAGGRLNVRSDGTLELTGTGAFDRENEPTVTIRVRAMDPSGGSIERDFTVSVTDEAEAPNAVRLISGTSFVSEEEDNADRVVATFAVDDADGSETSIRLLSQSGNVLRAVGSELRLPVRVVNFDTLAVGQELSDTDGDGLFEFVATASVEGFDGTLGSGNPVSYSLRIEDANEAPTLSGGGSVTLREDRPFDGIGNDRALVHDFDALDPDQLSDAKYRDLRYIITGGNDGDYFVINELTGELYLKKPLNYDVQNSFHLTVEARDLAGAGLASNAVALDVAVQDVNAPVLTTSRTRNHDQSSSSDLAQIAQNIFWVTAGRHAGNFIQISGYDQESGTNLRYEIEAGSLSVSESHFNSSGDDDYDGPAPTLHIDPATGLMRFDQPDRPNKDVEHEWEGGINNRYPGGDQRKGRIQLVYSFTVRVIDGDGDYTRLPMTVTFVRRGASVPPIVLDLDGDGVELVGLAASPVRFDMDDDGFVDQTGWAAADDGFLVLDKNGSGAIDSADELSFAADLAGAESDLEGLRAYDSNGNGRLDAADADFGRFQVWQDANQDGVSQAGELRSLAARGIASIDLALAKTGRRVTGSAENVIYATSTYERTDGTTGTAGDVFLAFLPGVPEGSEPVGVEHTGATEEVLAAEAANPAGPEEVEVPVIQGLEGDDLLVGTDFNDEFEGAGGNDTLVGGAGFDTAYYTGNLADYAIETRGGQMYVRGLSGVGLSDGTDALSSIEHLVFADGSIGYAAPIVLDMDGDGVKMKELTQSTVRFDIAGGKGQRTAWTKGGDAFLVLDRNGNGSVDGIAEMSFINDKKGAKSDLDGLTTYDSDKSGSLDRADRRFEHFLLWRDADGDGKSGSGELMTLAQAGITSISLAGDAVNKKWKVGDTPILNTLTFAYADGRTGRGADVALAFSTQSQEAEHASAARARQALASQSAIETAPRTRRTGSTLSAAGSLREFGNEDAAIMEANNSRRTAPDTGSSELNKLIQAMATFGAENDAVASADSINWKKSVDPLHYGLLTASGITK